MIEARFDDLTGATTSFRLSEPVGLIEATRPDEVVGAIAAAEAAAARGLWVGGFVAYEAAPAFDRSLRVRDRDPADAFSALPLAWFAMFERREETTLPEPRDPVPDGNDAAARDTETWRPSIGRTRYDAALARIREHIAAGETYQVNFTLRLRSRIEGDERGLYRDLCYAQRGAHAAYLNLGRYRVLSASPELFVRVEGRRITTRPMKGTAPRGRWFEEDEALAAALVASPKDRAENAMIVDLLRNDLGRVSRPGSVAWSHVFEAERYETVWQLTSTVASELDDDAGLAEVFAALFPSGSVSGAPKVRSMEIIAELEDAPRGVYCGAVGWIGPPGDDAVRASFNVAIRTVMLDTETGTAEYGVGGGITWDSVATSEFAEVIAKARVLATHRPPFELLETMRRDPGEPIRRQEEHRLRLERSAAFFGFQLNAVALASTLGSAGAGADHPVRIRLRLARIGSLDVAVTRLDVSGQAVVRVALDEPSIDPTDTLRYHKTTLRAPYEAARARHPDADDVLLVNDRGEVTEASSSNVAVRLDGRWWTPPLRCGLLPGTERVALIADGTLAERVIAVEDVRRAEGLALLNSVRGWREATLV